MMPVSGVKEERYAEDVGLHLNASSSHFTFGKVTSRLSCVDPPKFNFHSAVAPAAVLIINTHQERFIFKALFVSADKKEIKTADTGERETGRNKS